MSILFACQNSRRMNADKLDPDSWFSVSSRAESGPVLRVLPPKPRSWGDYTVALVAGFNVRPGLAGNSRVQYI